jgi:hypothetical protein
MSTGGTVGSAHSLSQQHQPDMLKLQMTSNEADLRLALGQPSCRHYALSNADVILLKNLPMPVVH